MSKSNIEFLLQYPINHVEQSIKKSVSKLSWRILDQGKQYITIKEEIGLWAVKFTNLAQIEIYWEGNENETSITFNGSIFGFGPIQLNHLNGNMNRLKNMIESEAHIITNTSNDLLKKEDSISEEIQKLAELLQKGLLTNDEFIMAKKKLLD